jgi:NTP-dependent ternary system trypsin peptidase co-occuring protein
VPDTALLKVPVDDGSDEFVEVQISRAELMSLSDSGVVLASDDGSRFEAATFSLSSAMDRVMPAVRVILGRLRTGAGSPDELTVELGLQIGGEAGVFFAKGTAEATVAVTMTWRRAAEENRAGPDAAR